MSKSVAIIGFGVVGEAYSLMFPEAVVYDEPRNYYRSTGEDGQYDWIRDQNLQDRIPKARQLVNECDMALICVPTNLKDDELDTSIVNELVSWLETPLILIKSALQPGTVDRLVKQTGKNIAVSVEMIGEGNYFIPYWKYPHAQDPRYHDFLIIGGEEETARRCADILWARMSPDINIHLISAIEAEICKFMENYWGAQKVTFSNMIYDICEKLGANYTKVLQAWGADGRTEKMHCRVVPGKRGWKSKCFDKDVAALSKYDDSGYVKAVIKANQYHLAQNEKE